MYEIAAAIVGVVLAALIGLRIREYRNLITYEITAIPLEISVKDGNVVPYETHPKGPRSRAFGVQVKLVNRGWKNISGVKLHSDADIDPHSVEKRASSISPETISIGKRGKSLELAIDFLPSKEEVTITFGIFSLFERPSKLTGAGTNYKVESIHYYVGYQNAVRWVKNLLLGAAVGAAAGLLFAEFYVE